jgi:hypothetical protein
LGSTTFVALIKFVTKFLLDSHPFLLEAIGTKQFWFIPFVSPFKVGARVLAFRCSDLRSSFCAICREKSILILGKHFKQIA